MTPLFMKNQSGESKNTIMFKIASDQSKSSKDIFGQAVIGNTISTLGNENNQMFGQGSAA